jgi:hypothetical protein
VSATDYVALERVPVGVCDHCKASYYDASVLRQAHALHITGARRTVRVPVARYVQVV